MSPNPTGTEACGYRRLNGQLSGNSAEPELRLYQTKDFLRRDGQVVRILIYFALRSDDSVELQHVEVIEEEMRAKKTPLM